MADYFHETDRLSPHYAHRLQAWGDGAWQCLTCGGLLCDRCHDAPVFVEGTCCAACAELSGEAL